MTIKASLLMWPIVLLGWIWEDVCQHFRAGRAWRRERGEVTAGASE
jgi:hypothetical protein